MQLLVWISQNTHPSLRNNSAELDAFGIMSQIVNIRCLACSSLANIDFQNDILFFVLKMMTEHHVSCCWQPLADYSTIQE